MDFGWRCPQERTTHGAGQCWKERPSNRTHLSSSIGANDGSLWTANLNMSSNRFEVITEYVSAERAIDTLAGLIPRIGRHSTATRGGESFVHQSDARVLSGRERDYATI